MCISKYRLHGKEMVDKFSLYQPTQRLSSKGTSQWFRATQVLSKTWASRRSMMTSWQRLQVMPRWKSGKSLMVVWLHQSRNPYVPVKAMERRYHCSNGIQLANLPSPLHPLTGLLRSGMCREEVTPSLMRDSIHILNHLNGTLMDQCTVASPKVRNYM